MAKLPLNFSGLVGAWKEVSDRAGYSGSILLAGEPSLVALAQQRFSIGGAVPGVWVHPLSELADAPSVLGELLVFLVSPEGEAEVLPALESAKPKGRAVIAVDEGPSATGSVSYPSRWSKRLSFSDTEAGWRRLFGLCAEAAGDHGVALGRRYPVIRTAAAHRVVYGAARENALIGLAFFMRGADMPAMTINQIKMVLSVGSLYGAGVDQERVVELAGVVGLGFGLRAVTRSLVREAPGVSWLMKATIGYAATLAMGLGAMRYYEKGAFASTSRVVALLGSLRS